MQKLYPFSPSSMSFQTCHKKEPLLKSENLPQCPYPQFLTGYSRIPSRLSRSTSGVLKFIVPGTRDEVREKSGTYPMQTKVGKYITYICIAHRKIKYIQQLVYINFKCGK
jgi:hypothetical protein